LDFGVDFAKLVIYFIFIVAVTVSYGIPIHIIRDLYLTLVSFIRRTRDMINYHTVMSTMDTRYPNVSESELEALPDRTCIICREEMFDGAKRLPCGHCFHLKCLKSWLERQQVCPTCRKSVLKFDAPQTPASTVQPTPQPSAQTINTLSAANHEQQFRPNSPILMPNVNSPSFATGRSPQFMMEPAAAFVVMPQESEEGTQRAAANLSPVIEAELERFGQRSTLRRSLSFDGEEGLSPRSDSRLMRSLSSQINYVEELLEEHQNLLRKLKSAEQLIRRSSSRVKVFSDEDEGDEDEKKIL
jgi:E3 ubiquitin-protein ligase synoviolin